MRVFSSGILLFCRKRTDGSGNSVCLLPAVYGEPAHSRNFFIKVGTAGTAAKDQQHVIFPPILWKGKAGNAVKGVPDLPVGLAPVIPRVAPTTKFHTTGKHNWSYLLDKRGLSLAADAGGTKGLGRALMLWD